MNANPLDITLLALACFLLGIIIGILVTGFRANIKVNQAYETSKKEHDEEKARLSLEVTEQLARMRVGLKQSVDAYESTLRVLAARLPLAEHGLNQLDGSSEPLHLPNFSKNLSPADGRNESAEEAKIPPGDKLGDSPDGALSHNGPQSAQEDDAKIPLGEASVPPNVAP